MIVRGREQMGKKANSQSISGRCKEDFGSDAIINTGDYRKFFREYPTERIEEIHVCVWITGYFSLYENRQIETIKMSVTQVTHKYYLCAYHAG